MTSQRDRYRSQRDEFTKQFEELSKLRQTEAEGQFEKLKEKTAVYAQGQLARTFRCPVETDDQLKTISLRTRPKLLRSKRRKYSTLKPA